MLNTGWGVYQGYANRRTQAKADGLDYDFWGAKTKQDGAPTKTTKPTATYFDMLQSGKWR
jgi:hypothetical protein